MRTILLSLCLMLTSATLLAQVDRPLRGSYKRLIYIGKGQHSTQTLTLAGTTTGRYTLVKEGGDDPGETTGYWTRSKIWRRHRDSMNVVILNYENKYHTKYLEIEPSGCLTPVTEQGERRKLANAYAPVEWDGK
jgi:hypothetical protein